MSHGECPTMSGINALPHVLTWAVPLWSLSSLSAIVYVSALFFSMPVAAEPAHTMIFGPRSRMNTSPLLRESTLRGTSVTLTPCACENCNFSLPSMSKLGGTILALAPCAQGTYCTILVRVKVLHKEAAVAWVWPNLGQQHAQSHCNACLGLVMAPSRSACSMSGIWVECMLMPFTH